MSVKVTDLSIAYRTRAGDVCPVDRVSFSVADGEIMGLAGESGCGKSTLGNSLVFLEGRMRHLGGRVELDDTELPIADFRAMRPYRMTKVSLVPQYAMSALNPTRRISKLTTDLLRSHGVHDSSVMAEMRRRLDLVGLSDNVLDRYSFELSGGMRQRVTVILSTLLNPSLLIADEVTSALDVSSQRAVGEMLLEFRDRGFVKSLIAITHDLSILAQIADSILVMYAGRLAEKASTGTIVKADAGAAQGQLRHRPWRGGDPYRRKRQRQDDPREDHPAANIVQGTTSASSFARGLSLPPESMVILRSSASN